jgi:hypothetical protein
MDLEEESYVQAEKIMELSAELVVAYRVIQKEHQEAQDAQAEVEELANCEEKWYRAQMACRRFALDIKWYKMKLDRSRAKNQEFFAKSAKLTVEKRKLETEVRMMKFREADYMEQIEVLQAEVNGTRAINRYIETRYEEEIRRLRLENQCLQLENAAWRSGIYPSCARR